MKKKALGLLLIPIFVFGLFINFNPSSSSLSLNTIEASAGDKGTLMGNQSGTRYCCAAGENHCVAAKCETQEPV